MYAPMILDPLEPEPFHYDREYVVMLSEWSFESAEIMLDKLKKSSGYYNFQKRDAGELFPMWANGDCGVPSTKTHRGSQPAERLSVVINPDEYGSWAFHCHLLLHMEAGMFRVVHVT